ncbi:hypothetical protein PHMEG_0003567 [Phytophthora megakarya]|uniref:Uncharacterized protein n=1 Tax=Phytophthora megakarya TaxID=4795 RepID=A0A225WXJ5_9STRA|nr:hypothetical protein PHMEG_0003567 [Phytophthora megakarya]
MPLYSNDKEFQACFHKVREALALLAAVAHVDQEGWRYLLEMHCDVFLGTEGEEVFEETIPARFLVYLIEDNEEEDYKEYVETLKNDIIQFCGVHQRTHPTRAYLKIMKRIAALDEQLKLGKPGIDLKIPVQVGFRVMDFMSYGVLSDILEPLEDIREAEKIIHEEWKQYEQNQKKKKDVEPGNLRCTFVLGPMIADFHDTKISAEVTNLMETLVKENVWFSQVNLWTFVDNALETKEHEKRVIFSRLMASVFDSTRRLPQLTGIGDNSTAGQGDDSDPLQLGTVHLECCALMGPREMESMGSGIVVSQTTKKLSMQLEMDLYDGSSVCWWKWIAYALFSKRAQTSSAVESLALISIRSMSIADMEAFAAIVTSDHPEEELFGCPRGQVEERDVSVKAGASFYWEMTNRGQPRRGSRAITCQSAVDSVRTFSDDGKSEWVNVLVPGYGWCHVRRGDLVFHEAVIAKETIGGVKDLRIGFDKIDPSVSVGLPNFLAIVGPSLKSLTLDTSQIEFDGNALIRSCPNLVDLSLCGGDMVDVRFDFNEFRANNEPVPELPVEWDNITALANQLSNPDSALAKCLRRLRVFLIDEWAAWGIIAADRTNRPAFQAGLRALLDMLEKNITLEYLDVIVPFGHFIYLDDFREHHLKPIDRSLKLPMETKLAFLSIFPSREKLVAAMKNKRRATRATTAVRALCQLDQNVISTIFSFAAPRVLREVYLRDPPRNNWEEPDRMPI